MNVDFLLVDESPEDTETLSGDLPSSICVTGTDPGEEPAAHIGLVESSLERLNARAESGNDAFLIIQSFARLVRAFNGMQPHICFGPSDYRYWVDGAKILHNAREIDEGGSLTIVASFMTNTGSVFDDLIYGKFAGTGDAEIRLDHGLAGAANTIAPFDVRATWCRHGREIHGDGCACPRFRSWLHSMSRENALKLLANGVERFATNVEFLDSMQTNVEFFGSTQTNGEPLEDGQTHVQAESDTYHRVPTLQLVPKWSLPW
jgi:transcription termination factor Rho